MAEVKYNATLENKVNTLTLAHFDELGEPDPFAQEDSDTGEAGTYIYITELDGTTEVTNTQCTISTEHPNELAVRVDLSGVSDVDSDYEHPKYEHLYSIRSSFKVYMYGKLNIVNIA